MKLGLSVGISALRGPLITVPPIITQVSAGSLTPGTDGDDLQLLYTAGTYATTNTSIVSVQPVIGGTVRALTYVPGNGDVVTERVTDDLGETRDFYVGVISVSGGTGIGSMAIGSTFTVG